MFYPIIKSIHLLCACIGYLVYDVFVFKLLKKGRSEVEFIKLKRELLKASALILGASFLLLLVSGGILASFYLNAESLTWENFFLQNHIQKMIWLKIALVALLLLCTLFLFYPCAEKARPISPILSSYRPCDLPFGSHCSENFYAIIYTFFKEFWL